jgi:hypothetical protein
MTHVDTGVTHFTNDASDRVQPRPIVGAKEHGRPYGELSQIAQSKSSDASRT